MKITAKENISLLNLVLETFPEISVSKAKKMIIYGSISHRDAVIKSPEYMVGKREIIEYTKYSGGSHIAKEKTDVPILYEDEYLIAVIKPSGVNVDASPNERVKSLFSLTKSYVKRKWGVRQNLFIVHEPQGDEAGVCIFAKTKKSQETLKKNFSLSKREYNAIVAGKPKHKNDKLSLWLKKGTKNRIFLEKPQTEGAQLCSIKYTTIENFDTYTHILINPQTYFPLQTRFILSHIGNPIVGDMRFGVKQLSANWLKFYCTKIELQHPATGKKLKIETSLPNTFMKVNLPIFAPSKEKGIEMEKGKEVEQEKE